MKCAICGKELKSGDAYQKIEEGNIIDIKKPNPINTKKPLIYFNYTNVKVQTYCINHKKR